MAVRILHGDCLDVLKTLEPESVHAVVTDPPYHLTTGKKGGSGEASVSLATPAGRARVTTGFMGMQWDGGDVALRPETWAAVLRVVKPGGYLLAFGGTRTYHRLVCAIEDAGFEVRDMVAWLYGSGFPKGTDKEKIPKEWVGFNTALKPAIEPIVLARKPMIGTLAENLHTHGCGAMNVDGCRIETEPRPLRQSRRNEESDAARNTFHKGLAGSMAVGETELGRWPANVVHDGSEEVVALFPSEAGAAAPVRGTEPTANGFSGAVKYSGMMQRVPGAFHDDGLGSAARFFYCAKASRADRNDGLAHLAEKPLLWSSGEQNPGSFQSANTKRSAQNHHPTVKPTELMTWLVKLVTPPGGTVLDPFMGSGSTGRGAVLGNFNFIGIEREEEYVAIARERIRAIAPLFSEGA